MKAPGTNFGFYWKTKSDSGTVFGF